MTVSFDVSEHARITDWIKSSTVAAAKRGLLSAAIRTVSYIHELIDGMPNPPIDKGLYKAGWRYEQDGDLGARVYNSTTHALFIEHGVRAENVKIGKKMLDALTEWVRRKGLVSGMQTLASGKTRRKTRQQVEDEARKIAWAIAMSMKKKGIFGSGYGIMKKARLKVPQFVREEVARENR